MAFDVSNQAGLKAFMDHAISQNQGGADSVNVHFTKVDGSKIDNPVLETGIWKDLEATTKTACIDSKAEFEGIIRANYGDAAETIIAHMNASQTDESGGLTVGMIKAARVKAAEVDSAAADIQGLLTSESYSSNVIAIAVSDLMDGQDLPRRDSTSSVDSQMFAIIQGTNVASPATACHDTASQLLKIMGTGDVTHAGGMGQENRTAAIESALKALKSDEPVIVQFKVTTQGEDGHSFSLVKKPNGKVDVYEAWSSPEASSTGLKDILPQSKTDLTLEQVEEALTKMASPDPQVRYEGYNALSTAYTGDPSHFEEGPGGEPQTDDSKISLETFSRELRSMDDIHAEFDRRIALATDFVARFGQGGS